MTTSSGSDNETPQALCCPITLRKFRDPVMAKDGHTYEKWAIEKHLQTLGGFSPNTRQEMNVNDLYPNIAMKHVLEVWKDLYERKVFFCHVDRRIKFVGTDELVTKDDIEVTFPNLNKYDGDVVDGKRDGYGVLYFPNGKKCFEGDWKNGLFHGRGTLYDSGTGVKWYEGEFEYGKLHGRGTEYYITGDTYYEGYYVYGKRNCKRRESDFHYPIEGYDRLCVDPSFELEDLLCTRSNKLVTLT